MDVREVERMDYDVMQGWLSFFDRKNNPDRIDTNDPTVNAKNSLKQSPFASMLPVLQNK